ncbi:hypothetical protein WBG78_27165 [Chryseolinea sp. T2]|uniref:hypothetical protein n=1 Tax=Chryseolinea sp. T2 TaxID=3129255 RepID=UPI003077DF81
MKKVIAIFGIIMTSSAIAQEVPLLKLDDPIKGFNRKGTWSIYAKSGSGPNISSLPPRIDVTEGTDGVIVRGDFHLAKYDFEGRKKWEVTMEKEFGLPAQPYMKILTDEIATYIIEVQTQLEFSERVRITHITNDGVKKEYAFHSDLNKFITDPKVKPAVIAPYLVKGELKILAESKDFDNEDENTPPYRLYTMDLKSGKLISKDIVLPVDQDEENAHSWDFAGLLGNNAILTKSFIKRVKKQEVAVVEVLEMDPEGRVINHRKLDFRPSEVADREFIVPSLFWNAEDRSIVAVGFMWPDKSKLNALYLIKYDYATGNPVYRQEHSFEKILKPEIKTDIKAHYSIPEYIYGVYSVALDPEDVLISSKTNTLEVRIITAYNFGGMNFFQVKFDNNGQHIQTAIAQYGADLTYYRSVVPQPEEYQLVWKDRQINSTSSWDLINMQVSGGKSDASYFVPLNRTNKVVKYDQEKGSFWMISPKP